MLHVLAGMTLLPAVRPSAPPQPRSGPGGADYAFDSVKAHLYKEDGKFWIFEPADPKPSTAPVIAFVPGWGGIHPAPYRAWIDHLVRHGHIVVYPIYQSSLLEFPWRFTANSVARMKGAMRRLRRRNHVAPDWERFAIVGHSAGGFVSANLAAEWKKNRLPQPRALMTVQPGLGKLGGLSDLSQLDSSTLLLSVGGDEDAVVGCRDAMRIYREATHVPARNRNYVLFRTDRYGWPWMHSGHFSPCSLGKGQSHAVDWYGYWKLFDGLCDAAFYGKNRRYALGNTPQQRFMGFWSDGTPVRELLVIDDPDRI